MSDEKRVANEALVGAAASASQLVNAFSMWLLAGFGAAAGLLINTLDSETPPLPAGVVRFSVFLFIASLAAATIQRFLAMLVASLAAGNDVGLNAFSRTGVDPKNLDAAVFLDAMKEKVWWPMSWAFKLSERRLTEGDFTFPGRVATATTLIQGCFMLLQVIVLGVAALQIARALAV